MKLKFVLILLINFLLFNSCLKSRLEGIDDAENTSELSEYNFPADFDFATTRDIQLELAAPEYIKDAVFEVYTIDMHNDQLIAKGSFDTNSEYNSILSIPSYIDSIEIRSLYFGLEHSVKLSTYDPILSYDYGIHYTAERENAANSQVFENEESRLKSAAITNFTYMGPYTANGYPNYLFQVNDHAWESLLSNLNQTLPEGKSVPQNKPQFIASGAETNLVLKSQTNVYVTFAGEGTEKTSALGYFIYNGSSPDAIKPIIIFPNASYPGSGGSLHSGDKVLLGNFPAGTTIGWFLVPNGWSKNDRIVSDREGIYYSIPDWNPESNSSQKQHMVQLKDIQNEVIVLGFEDQARDGATDNDFNDAVFYITLDNYEAANLDNVYATSSPVDTDGDGIIDALDAYPTDPNLAFNNHLVSGSSGSLAFEDLWPSKGDFDFNDLVINYNYNPITDANNLVKVLEINLTVAHCGASYHNGFAIELPISASAIASVSGAKMTRGYVNLAANGTESGVSNAVIFAFEDGWDVVNQNFTISVTFTNPISTSSLGTFPFNPFIVIDGNRSMELHLPDMPPTSKASSGYFGSQADYSNPGAGRYYRTKENLPWAINIASNYSIPREKQSIEKGYLKFMDWAKSAGKDYSDWYLNVSGYRDQTYLF